MRRVRACGGAGPPSCWVQLAATLQQLCFVCFEKSRQYELLLAFFILAVPCVAACANMPAQTGSMSPSYAPPCLRLLAHPKNRAGVCGKHGHLLPK